MVTLQAGTHKAIFQFIFCLFDCLSTDTPIAVLKMATNEQRSTTKKISCLSFSANCCLEKSVSEE